jgi:hypothetical protein
MQYSDYCFDVTLIYDELHVGPYYSITASSPLFCSVSLAFLCLISMHCLCTEETVLLFANLNVAVAGMQQYLLHNGQSEPDPLPVPVFTQVLLGHLQFRAVQQPKTRQCHRLWIQTSNHNTGSVWSK